MRARFIRQLSFASWLSLCTVACRPDPDPLTEGAAWVSTEVPEELRSTVARFEHVESFGMRNDPHGWQGRTRITLRADVPIPNAGCTTTDWIPGTWTAEGSTLTVVTDSPRSGSREIHDCPDGSMPRTDTTRPDHFVRARSPFRVEGRTLRLETGIGVVGSGPVVLRRSN